jgi:hypothetical protein
MVPATNEREYYVWFDRIFWRWVLQPQLGKIMDSWLSEKQFY